MPNLFSPCCSVQLVKGKIENTTAYQCPKCGKIFLYQNNQLKEIKVKKCREEKEERPLPFYGMTPYEREQLLDEDNYQDW